MSDTDFEYSNGMPESRKVGFVASFSLFFKNYFQFQGRSSRGAHWYFVLWNTIVTIIAALIDISLFGSGFNDLEPVGSLWALITFIPSVSLCVRRLHDIGKSGWWSLIAFTIIGILLLIFWACQPGDRYTNKYGEDKEAGRA